MSIIQPPAKPHRTANDYSNNGFPIGTLRVTPRCTRLLHENEILGGLEEFADLVFSQHNAVQFLAGKPIDGNWGHITDAERESNLNAIGGDGKSKQVAPNSRGRVVSRHELSKTGEYVHILTNFETGETHVHCAADTDEPIEYLNPLEETE